MDSLNFIPKLHVRTRWSKRDNGDYFLFNDEFDSQMTVSESALLVLESINGEHTVKEITDKLTEYQSDEDDYKYVNEFICHDLLNNHILDNTDLSLNKKRQTFNIILLKERFVRPICCRLLFLFNKKVNIALYLSLFGISIYSAFSNNIPTHDYSNWYLFTIGAFFLILLHEFGHCTALHYCGLQSKGIGVGIHFVFPMVFAEVTQAWVLSPKKRMVVDLGGFHFQLIITF